MKGKVSAKLKMCGLELLWRIVFGSVVLMWHPLVRLPVSWDKMIYCQLVMLLRTVTARQLYVTGPRHLFFLVFYNQLGV